MTFLRFAHDHSQKFDNLKCKTTLQRQPYKIMTKVNQYEFEVI